MQMKNYPARMIGLLLVGFLTVPLGMVYAQGPVIEIKSPTGEPRYVRTSDPIDPEIIVDVAVEFPIVETPCVGANPPVDTSTLEVYLWKVIDADMQEEWSVDTSSGWEWTGTDPDRVEGQVTIGGLGSGQDRSRYGIRVCIENEVERKCKLGGFLRVEIPVTNFFSASYETTRITFFSQDPAGCVIPGGLMGTINQLIATIAFPVGVNMSLSTATFGSMTTPLPLMGIVAFGTSLDEPNNNVVLEQVTIDGIDLSQLGVAGYNCLVGGSADGILLGEVSPWSDLDGSMRIFDISVELGGGIGGCSLTTPGPECNINFVFDGNP